MSRPAHTVSGLLGLLKAQLAEDYRQIWVRGEVAGWTASARGHCYFSLRDRQGVLQCVLWASRTELLDFQPREGMDVLALGSLTCYAPRGQLQFSVDQLVPDGVGQYFVALEALKQRLAAEGLFAPERKRRLPFFPRRVGVVTSLEGAVWHDIQTTLLRRNPAVQLILSPSPVQGPEAVGKLVRALRLLLEQQPDVVILARGGGSWEDLMAFNHEHLVRFLARYPVPVLTAVGHETDTSLVDHVADGRAPTPTAAAELVAPELAALADQLGQARARLAGALHGRVTRARAECDTLRHRPPFLYPLRMLEAPRHALTRARDQMRQALAVRLAAAQAERARTLLRPALLRAASTRQREELAALRGRLERALQARTAASRADFERCALRPEALASRATTARAEWRERQASLHAHLARRLEQARSLRASLQLHPPRNESARLALEEAGRRLAGAGGRRLEEARRELSGWRDRLALAGALLPQRPRARLEEATAALHALSPLSVLGRGYAVCRDSEGRLVSSVRGRNPSEQLEIWLADGTLGCRVESVSPERPPA